MKTTKKNTSPKYSQPSKKSPSISSTPTQVKSNIFIQSTLKLIIPNSPYENDKEKYIAQVFTTIQEIPLHLLHPDPSEIQYFQSFSLEEAKTLINQHPEKFAPSFRIHFQRFIEKYTQ